MQKISPCLWFDHQAEEAAKLYTSIFSNSKIGKLAYYNEDSSKVSGQKIGSVMTVEFEIEGYKMLGLNGGHPSPEFDFTPSVSFFVRCASEQEIEDKWKKLSQGGDVKMELQKYPFAEKYGWCDDKFGVGWQLILDKEYKQKISPALLFVQSKFGKGEEAVKFYTKVFKDSEIVMMEKDKATNSILHSMFKIEGQEVILMESGMKEHKYDMTQAISFMVNCKTQAEIDYYWENLSVGGEIQECGWLRDKFGVAWQIVPAIMNELMSSSDKAKSERVMKAMLKMKKLDIETLKNA